MKGKILKKLNENTPDVIKMIMSKQIRAKVINNDVFKKEFEEIQYFEKLNLKEKERIHLERVKGVLIYSYENTEYYGNLFKRINFNPYEFKDLSELNKIPTISKEDVLNNFEKIISKEDIDHYEAFTGGSTGKPLKILLDTASIYKEKAYVYNYWSKFGYDYRKSKIITFRGLEFSGKLYKYNPIDNQIILNPFKLNEENIDQYINIINKFKPEFIHGYVSAIHNFCKILNKKNLKINSKIKCIFFVSENVTEGERRYIRDTLNCDTNIFYGHSERCVFAENYEGGYIFNDMYTHVDFINSNEEGIYEIACTGLINKKMPLIRYVPDDKIMIKNDNILIQGHWEKELLIGKNNEKISIASINFHNDIFDKISLYQFEQFEKGKVVLKIVEDSKLYNEDLDRIKEIIYMKLKDVIDIEIKCVRKIHLTKRGKYKKIIKHI